MKVLIHKTKEYVDAHDVKFALSMNINYDINRLTSHLKPLLKENIKNKRQQCFNTLHLLYNDSPQFLVEEAALNMVCKYDNVHITLSKQEVGYPVCDFFRTIVNNKPLIIMRVSGIKSFVNETMIPFIHKLLREWDYSKLELCIMTFDFDTYNLLFSKEDSLFSQLFDYIKSNHAELQIKECSELFIEIKVSSIARTGVLEDIYKLCDIVEN